jgi:hypothetical protein
MRTLAGCKPEGEWNMETTSTKQRSATFMMNDVMNYNVKMNETKLGRLRLLIAEDASLQS